MWLLTVFGNRSRSAQSRKDERFVTETLTSPLGRVKDVSGSGVCITGEGRRGALTRGKVVPLKLDTPRGALTFLARVAWVKKTRQGYEAGLSLLDVKPRDAKLLRQLGAMGYAPSRKDVAAEELTAPVPPIAPKLCEALGVTPDATDEQVFRAYRRLALAYHPDRNRSGEAALKFQRAADAYRTLKRIRPGLSQRSGLK